MIEFTTFDGLALAVGAMLAGIFMLIKGGDWVVDASVYVAERHGVSPLLVGFTIVAFGTSLPELIVSVLANLKGSPGIAIGNVLGSNIANILLVIGAGAFFATLRTSSKGILKDLAMMMVATVALAAFLLHGEIGRIAGLVMVVALVGYVIMQYRMVEKGELPAEAEEEPVYANKFEPYFYLIIGLIVIALGAEFLVRGATVTADSIGVPDAVIALSVIALGTSLPELSTSIIAAKRGHSDIVLGNIIGSNVFNILMILGITTMIQPILQGSFAPQLVNFDIWVVMATSLIFSLLLVFFGKITRPVGIVFVLAYVVYNVYIYAIYITT